MTDDVTSLAGKTLADDNSSPLEKTLAAKILSHASAEHEGGESDLPECAEEDKESGQVEGSGETGAVPADGAVLVDSGTEQPAAVGESASDDQGGGEGVGSVVSESRLTELLEERSELARKHTKMLDMPGYAATVLFIQKRIADIDGELGE